MYEVWLGLNILYEIALSLWPALSVLLLVWLSMVLWKRKDLKRVNARVLLAVAVLGTAVATIALPSMLRSSLSDMGYWVDWAMLLVTAAGLGVAAAVLLWPLLARAPDKA
jgi:hypothetical protein